MLPKPNLTANPQHVGTMCLPRQLELARYYTKPATNVITTRKHLTKFTSPSQKKKNGSLVKQISLFLRYFTRVYEIHIHIRWNFKVETVRY